MFAVLSGKASYISVRYVLVPCRKVAGLTAPENAGTGIPQVSCEAWSGSEMNASAHFAETSISIGKQIISFQLQKVAGSAD